jgi:hypothetical protein
MTTMQAEDIDRIEDVLNLSTLLSQHAEEDAAHNPSLIAALIEWRDCSAVDVSLSINPNEPSSAVATPKSKRGKATEPDDSVPGDGFTPDPTDEPDF